MPNDLILIYMTCAHQEEAENIAQRLLEKKLIACANILAPMTSLYVWEGQQRRSSEIPVIMKSRANLFEEIKNEVLSLHSYDCPCVVAWPLAKGNPVFLNWIADSTKSS